MQFDVQLSMLAEICEIAEHLKYVQLLDKILFKSSKGILNDNCIPILVGIFKQGFLCYLSSRFIFVALSLSQWKCALVHLNNHVVASNNLDVDSLTSLQTLLDHVTCVWQEQQLETRLKDAEQESLYKYKARTHGSDLTEDEQELKDLHQQFPTFHQVKFTLRLQIKVNHASKRIGNKYETSQIRSTTVCTLVSGIR